jgi:Uma2 family endonuclease
LIEVSDSSLATGKGAKLEPYARAGIREFWIVDLTTNTVILHCDPGEATYAAVTHIDSAGSLDVQALPGVTIPAGSILA